MSPPQGEHRTHRSRRKHTALNAISTICRAGVLAMAGLALTAAAFAKGAEGPLFQSEAALAITLQAPWSDLSKNAKDQRRHAAVLSYTDAQGVAHRIEATVETRGLTRLRYCNFPPLRLRFAKGATQGTVFAGQRSLKMVTHCRGGQQFEQYYVLEMLAYRIYNRVTDLSYRVRPLDVSYVDTADGEADGPRFAFLIEDTDDMASRNGLKPDPAAKFAVGDFDAPTISRLMMFQYLIGNTDFAVLSGPQPDECCHNVRVIGPGDGQGRVAVPYDFDSGGFVGASYAAPHESLPIKDVRQRLYRGFCVHNDGLAAARAEFLAQRKAIFDLIDGESRLTTKARREATRYVEAFYTTLNSEYGFASEFSGKCRK
jgi:hypothetical protein